MFRHAPPGVYERDWQSPGTHWLQHSHNMRSVQYSTVRYSAVQYSTVQCSIVQHSTVQCSIVQYSTVQHTSATTYISQWYFLIPHLCVCISILYTAVAADINLNPKFDAKTMAMARINLHQLWRNVEYLHWDPDTSQIQAFSNSSLKVSILLIGYWTEIIVSLL